MPSKNISQGGGMTLELIVAIAQNDIIGKEGSLPWHLPNDLKFFKRTTMGKAMIMGRKTWESFPKPLPGRDHIVLTKGKICFPPSIERLVQVPNQAEAIKQLNEKPGIIIGGAHIYGLFFSKCTTVHLTRVKANVAGDTKFHIFDELERSFTLTHAESHPSDDKHAHPFEFETWVRK